jgi:hypothetical protein
MDGFDGDSYGIDDGDGNSNVDDTRDFLSQPYPPPVATTSSTRRRIPIWARATSLFLGWAWRRSTSTPMVMNGPAWGAIRASFALARQVETSPAAMT